MTVASNRAVPPSSGHEHGAARSPRTCNGRDIKTEPVSAPASTSPLGRRSPEMATSRSQWSRTADTCTAAGQVLSGNGGDADEIVPKRSRAARGFRLSLRFRRRDRIVVNAQRRGAAGRARQAGLAAPSRASEDAGSSDVESAMSIGAEARIPRCGSELGAGAVLAPATKQDGHESSSPRIAAIDRSRKAAP
jgi:hypothetical protein